LEAAEKAPTNSGRCSDLAASSRACIIQGGEIGDFGGG
jgi:hypothetical protein